MRVNALVGLVCLSISFSGLAEEGTPLTLKDLLKVALAHDGRVLAAHAQLDAYRARYLEAWLSWVPVINFEAAFGGPVGERRLTCDSSTPPDECLKVNGNRVNINFGAHTSFAVGGKLEGMVPLFTFGKLSAAKEAAAAGVDAGTAGIAQARQEVALEVRRAYYGWSLARAAIAILEDGEEKLKEAEQKLQKMLDEMNEDVTDQDQFKLRYYSTQVKIMLIQARQGQNVALAALRFLTGIENLGDGQALVEKDLSTCTAFTPEKRDEYISRAIRARPDLKMLSAGLAATGAQLDLEKANFLPDFFLAGYVKGSYSPVQDYINNPLLQQGLTNYDAGAVLGLRLTLDFPQKIARRRRAEAEYTKVQAQLEQARAALGLEIDKRLEEVKLTLDSLDANQKGGKAAKSWMRANMMSYGVGFSNTKDLLDSLVAHARSQMDLDKVSHDFLVAVDQLLMASGEDLSQAQ
jgi:multidrug efflux system outer membrane protein